MTSFPSVSVCFPAYNEEGSIEEVLREAGALLSSSGLEYEILVCDDGSVDRTGDIVDNLAHSYSNFRVFHNPRNLGIHSTFERLYSEATKEFVFLNAADRQWNTTILLEMLPLTKDWDIIVASRKNKPYGPFRKFVSYCFNLVPYVIFGVRTFDAGAVKLVRREIINRFKLASHSSFSEAERLIRAARAGYKITEYPVHVLPRRSGRAHGGDFKILLGSCTDIFRVWRSIHQGPGKGK